MAKGSGPPQIFLESVRRAQRNQMPVGWLGWLIGALFTAIGLYDPRDAPLVLAVGVVLLVGMTVFTVRRLFLRFRLVRVGRAGDDGVTAADIDPSPAHPEPEGTVDPA